MSNEIKRTRYFNGLLLEEGDLNLDQKYHLRLHRLHNRYFHDWGIVDGLTVTAVDQTTPRVRVSQGLALNRIAISETEEHSQEIWVSDTQSKDELDLSNYRIGEDIYITVSYEEKETDADSRKGGHETRIWECATIRHDRERPADPKKDIILAVVRTGKDQEGRTVISDIIYDKDAKGNQVCTYAVLEGRAVEFTRLAVGPADSTGLPFIEGLEETPTGEGIGLDVRSPYTEFSGSVTSNGPLNAKGSLNVEGTLNVTVKNSQALKVDSTGNVNIAKAASVGDKLSVAGGLDVKGESATIGTAQVNVTGNTITISKYTPDPENPDPKDQNSGLEVFRGGVAPSARLVWDEGAGVWKAGTDAKEGVTGSGMYAVAYGPSWESMCNRSNVDGLHKHSRLSTAAGDLAVGVDTSGNAVVEKSVVVKGTVLAQGGAIEVPRAGVDNNARIAWNEGTEHWQVKDGTQMYDLAYGDKWYTLSSSAIADKLHKHSELYNGDGSVVSLRVNGAGDVDIKNDLTVEQDLTVVGDLTVRGTTTTVNAVNLEVTDSVIVVNKHNQEVPLPTEGGLEVYRGVGYDNARIIWDEGSNRWKIGVGDQLTEIPLENQWEALMHGQFVEDLHKHGSLYTTDGVEALTVNSNGNTQADGDMSVIGDLAVDSDAQITGDLSVGGSVTVEGDLTVNGTTTIVSKSNIEVKDKVIIVNKYTGQADPGDGESGLEVYRGMLNDSAKIVWNEKEDKWKVGAGGEMFDLPYGENWHILTGRHQADNLHNHNALYDTAGNAALLVDTQGKLDLKKDTQVEGSLKVNGSVNVDGTLLVQGQIVSRTDMRVTDSVIHLNEFEGQESPVTESGIEINRGSNNPKARLMWDNSKGIWKIGTGTNLREVVSGSEYGKLINKSNADALHLHSQIYNGAKDILALSASALGNIDVTHNLTVGQDAAVLGNLTVKGVLTNIQSDIVEVKSKTVQVNRFEGTDTPGPSGISVFRGLNVPSADILWDEANSKWKTGMTDRVSETFITASTLDKSGNMEVLGNLTVIKNDGTQNPPKTVITANKIQTESADIKTLNVGTGIGVLRSPNPKAVITWSEEDGMWKMGTISKTGLCVTQTGKIGIGTETPTSNLDVVGKATVNGDLTVTGNLAFGSAVVNNALTVKGGFTTGDGVVFDGGSLPSGKIYWDAAKEKWYLGKIGYMQELTLTDHTHDKLCYTLEKSNTDGTKATETVVALSVSNSGNVSIGTSNHGANLTVAGTATFAGIVTAKVGLDVDVNGNATAKLHYDESTKKWQAATHDDILKNIALDDHTHDTLGKGSTPAIKVVSGNVGIGLSNTENPTGKLDVRGDLKAESITVAKDLNLTTIGYINVNRSTGKNAQILWDEGHEVWQTMVNNTAKNISLEGHTHNTLCNAGGSTPAVTVDASGNVTVAVDKKLSANGLLEAKAGLTVSNGNLTAGVTTVADLTVNGNLNISGTNRNVTIDGGPGTITTINSENLVIGDNIIRVNQSASNQGGLEVYRPSDASNTAQIIWDDNSKKWRAGSPGVAGGLKDISLEGHTHNVSVLCNAGSSTSALTVDVNGYIGIGAVATGKKLNVEGDARVKDNLNTGSLNAGITTVSDLTVTGVLNVNGTNKNVTISGGPGTTTTINSENLVIGDNIIRVNQSASNQGGVEVCRPSDANNTAQIIWDDTSKKWRAGSPGVDGGLKDISLEGHTHNVSVLCNSGSSTSALTVDASGNVGIGTLAPAANMKLDVQGSAKVSTNLTVDGILTANSGSITTNLTVGGTLTVSGSTASINTVTLEAKSSILTVNKNSTSATNTVGGLEVYRGNSKYARIIWDEGKGKWQIGTSEGLADLLSGSHNHQGLYATSTSPTPALTVDTNGNVGIGSVVSDKKFNVDGDAKVRDNLTAGTATVNGLLEAKAGLGVTGGLTTDSATINNNLTVKGNLTTDGGAGTVTSINSEKLEIRDNIVRINNYTPATTANTMNCGLEVFRGSLSSAYILWDETYDYWKVTTPAGTMKEISVNGHTHSNLCKGDGSDAITVDATTGKVGIGTVPPTTPASCRLDVSGAVRASNIDVSSSRSYKENIKQLTTKAALELLNKLNPVSFDFKIDSSKKHNIGFIAEEVPDVFTTSERKSVSLMDIIGVLTAVVKKQEKETTALRKQVTTLQKQIAAFMGA